MKNYQVARNWNRDGWTEKDWDHVTECAENLRAIAAELDNAVGGGGGGFEPSELAELSKRAQAVAERAQRISGGYVSVINEKIIMFDSPEAAQFRTDIHGWVARNHPYAYQGPNAEEAARYQGCTHIPCKQCDAPTEKHHSKCDACCELADLARYQAMPRAEWDGKAMLYSETTDRYYSDLGEAEDHLDEMEERCTLADLRLTICTPNYASPIDPDYFADEMGDGELPDEIYDAMEAFNEAVDGIVLSWSPGQTALALPVAASGSDDESGSAQ